MIKVRYYALEWNHGKGVLENPENPNSERDADLQAFDSRANRDAWVLRGAEPHSREVLSSKDSILRRALRSECEEEDDIYVYYHYSRDEEC